MKNNSISIDTAQINALAEQISHMNTNLNEKLIAIKSTLKLISEEWDSPAGEKFEGSVKDILPDFEYSTMFINKYANFLNVTAETYEETEKKIKNSASSFS